MSGPVIAVLLVACGACGSVTSRPSASTYSSAQYCSMVKSAKPRSDMSFDARLHLIRSVYGVSPPPLKPDFEQVLLAYQEIEDGENGTIPADQVTRIYSTNVAQAQRVIASSMSADCGVDIGTFQAPQ